VGEKVAPEKEIRDAKVLYSTGVVGRRDVPAIAAASTGRWQLRPGQYAEREYDDCDRLFGGR
jgi:hypothetical protein